MLNTEVIAPDFTLLVDGAGRLYISRGVSVEEKDFKCFTPKPKEY